LVSVGGTINGISETAAYTYDVLGRAATSSQSSNGSTAQRRFAYDRWGNRTGVWDSTSGGNQIQSVTLQQSDGAPTNQIQSVTGNGSGTYVYDSAGNVTGGGTHTYSYDAENRLVSVDGGSTAQYAYDFRGRRVKKIVAGATTHYIWRGSHALAEHDGSTGNVLQDYILAGKSFIAKINANGTFYFVGDRLSERLRLDSNGNVAAQGGHLPFGEDFAETGGVEKHHFTSYERDNETGADYAVNRLYSSGVGRFTAVDRLSSSAKPGRPQTLNRYTYSSGDPVNLVDPTGLDAFSNGAGGGVDESNPCPDGFYYIGTFLTDAGEETDCGYDPLPGPPDPATPLPTCSFDVNSKVGETPWGREIYQAGPRTPPVDPFVDVIGDYARGGTWFYFFEVQLNFELQSGDRKEDWTIRSATHMHTRDLIYNRNGTPTAGYDSLDLDPEQTQPQNKGYLDDGTFILLDTPGANMTFTPRGESTPYDIISGTWVFDFTYEGQYKGQTVCRRSFSLLLHIEPGKHPAWSGFGVPAGHP
jgi:RHS repeat-associated protein